MAKYLMIFKSGTPFDIANMPKDQVVQVMQAWGEWLGSMGAAVIDKGDPLKAKGKKVGKDGISNADEHSAGYLVIEAEDFDEALSMAKTSPIIARGGNVEVYEAFAV